MLRLMPTRRAAQVLNSKEDVFDHFFDDFFAPLETMSKQLNSFKVDVIENADGYVIKADLPGFKKEDLNVTYDSNYLTISAKRESEQEEKNDHYVRRERQSGEFRRSFYIENVILSEVDATFENGTLAIRLKKEVDANAIKTIEIK